MSVKEKMTAIADAIRAKSGGTEALTLDEMAAEISEINTLNSDISEYNQMNDKVTAYLAAADTAYTDSNSASVSVMADYQTATGDKDRPLGFAMTATDGTSYLQNEDSGEGWALPISNGVTNTLYNAIPGDTSRYIVKATDGTFPENGRIKPTGKVRMVRFYGYIRNCRDLGGWDCDGGTVKYGRLFRSAAPASVETWIDPKIAASLGIRKHIDFRGDSEANNATESNLGADVQYKRLTLNLYYDAMVAEGGADYPNLKTAMRELIESATYNVPTLFNCSLGRDRTGAVAFLLLALLGVSRADIDKDYELSCFSPENAPGYRTRADYNAMATYLTSLGGSTLRDGAVWWFLNAGFSLAELNAFRAAMTDGTPDELTAADFIQTWSVTNSLSYCSNSNAAASVQDGASYTATITAQDGYELSTVTVTMGGADVTATAYSGGVVSIEGVTGNIVITAAAVESGPNYTNVLPTATDADGSIYGGKGYQYGYRLSSGGTPSGSNQSYTTGFIPCKVGDVVRLQNIAFGSDVSVITTGNQRLAFYDENKALVLLINSSSTADAEFSVVRNSENGWTQFTVPASSNWNGAGTSTDLSGVRFFRMNGTYMGDDSIITVNEEITD